MKIWFYEEFPSDKNLEKARKISFPTTIFLAARSISEFKKLRKKLQAKNKRVLAEYWPILEKGEGYWISPFADSKAIKRIISELEREKQRIKVVWDMELPVHHKWLLIKNLPMFLYNKKIIHNFLKRTKHEIFVTENIILGTSWAGIILGRCDKGCKTKKTLMFYTSMLGSLRNEFFARLEKEKKRLGKRLTVGLGTIAPGIRGDEAVMSTRQLDMDLRDMKALGIEKVWIFRLGGLNPGYLKVIGKYLT
ncbi:MAG: hypothetical protein V1837_02145 [Candidatus Woesearchaeota archaeon]